MTKKQAEREEHRYGQDVNLGKKRPNQICGEGINIVHQQDAPDLWDKTYETAIKMRSLRQNRNGH